MTEQETEEVEEEPKKTKEEYKKEWEESEVIVEEDGEIVQYNSLGTKPLYYSKDFLKRLGELYIEHRNFNVVTKTLRNEFNCNVSTTTIQKLYYKEFAKVLNSDEKSKEFFEDSFNEMKKRWKLCWKIVGRLSNSAERILDKLEGKEDGDIKILSISSQLIPICKEIRNQLEFIRTQQEQIKIQQTNLIYSPIQINQYLHKFIKSWVDKGYIQILKQIPELDEVKGGKNGKKTRKS